MFEADVASANIFWHLEHESQVLKVLKESARRILSTEIVLASNRLSKNSLVGGE